MSFERARKKQSGPGIFITNRQFELFWLLCHAAMNGKLSFELHPDFKKEARELEPKLYALVQELEPGWSHPLRENN